jgi:transglutaminase-like putative cysteine protease
MTNHRLTFAAGLAVIAAALSLLSLLQGGNWLSMSIGVVVAVSIAGTLTRLTTLQSAVAASIAVLLAFVPPLAGLSWPGGAAALALLALTAASATGSRLPRLFATLATYLAVTVLYLNVVFAGGASFGGLIPSRRSLAQLARLPSQASGQFKFRPPIYASRPVELIAVAGIAVIAISVDILAVRLRRPALAGLPLLLLFSVPVATSLKHFGILQSLGFGIGIAAYLGLLSVDGRQRLRMWGRLVTIHRLHAGEEGAQGPDTRQLAATGRRVALAAVAVAMVVPVFLAGNAPRDVFGKTSNGRGSGGGVSIPGGQDSLVSIGNELAGKPVLELTYRTNAADPTSQYLQEYVLNLGPDERWEPGASGGRQVGQKAGQNLPYTTPAIGAGISVATVRTTVTMRVPQVGPLPLPFAPARLDFAKVPALEETQGTLMVFGLQQQNQLKYTVTSKEVAPTTAQLSSARISYPASVMHDYDGYNGADVNPLLAIAAKHTAHATTPLQQAMDLQNWLTSPAFTYTLKAKWPDSGPWLLSFLTKDRRGDCEQFAPAFAILARLLGIPARLAVGFTAGTEKAGGVWDVTSADAHAWPELWFPQVGWIRFEPTPSGAGQQGTASTPLYAQKLAGGGTGPNPQVTPGGATASSGPSANASAGIHARGKPLNADDGSVAGGASPHASSAFPVGILIALVIFLLLAWPGLGRWLTSRRRWMAASGPGGGAPVAWRELLDYLTDYGVSWLPSDSPRAISRRVAEVVGSESPAAAAVTRIGAAEEHYRYAQHGLPDGGLRADIVTARRGLAANVSRVTRLRARLLPASTLEAARRGLHSVNRALSWIDAPLPSLRRMARRGGRPRTS